MLHDALRIIRKYHQLEPNDIVVTSGITRSYLSEIESGRRNPGTQVISRLAKCYAVRISVLYLVSEALDDCNYVGEFTTSIQTKVYGILNQKSDI